MNEKEIEVLLRRAIGPRFLGVFAADELPNHISSSSPQPNCFIANTDPSSLGGSHWVAFYVLPDRRYEFFDSYAIDPLIYFPNSPLVLDSYPPHATNPKPLQRIDSSVCGHYCIYFLYLRSVAHQSLDSIVRSFNHFIHPDQIVKSFVEGLFKNKN